METDFNFSDKATYGVGMMDNTRKHGYVPKKGFSENNRMDDDELLAKVLFFDIIRQTQLDAGLGSANAAN